MAAELSYQAEIEALLEQHTEQLQFIPFVSQEDTDFAIRGRVTTALENGLLEQRAGLALSAGTSQVMICGNPSMVHDTQTLLEARGLKKNKRRDPGQITTEQYWKAAK
jgi:ferredoxin--NADP+ reductase